MSRSFSTISKIDLDDSSTWADRLFLTFDIDWAHDKVLKDTAALVHEASVPATWFATHATPVLDEIRALPRQELGLHPNFNPLLDGVAYNGRSAMEILESLMNIVPEAKSIRSHSMTQSSRLLNLFQACGLTHEVNHFIPQHANIELKPWLMWNQLCKVPYCWEDDVHILYESTGISQRAPVELATATGGLRVFDFHPIHVFLNTESLDRYERTRPLHNKPKELIKHRYEGYGTRDRLIELLQLAKNS
jgi:hypothetical protein